MYQSCSSSLAIRKKLINFGILSYPNHNGKYLRSNWQQNCGGMWEMEKSYSLIVGLQTCLAAMELGVENSLKLKIDLPCDSDISPLSKWLHILSHRKLSFLTLFLPWFIYY